MRSAPYRRTRRLEASCRLPLSLRWELLEESATLRCRTVRVQAGTRQEWGNREEEHGFHSGRCLSGAGRLQQVRFRRWSSRPSFWLEVIGLRYWIYVRYLVLTALVGLVLQEDGLRMDVSVCDQELVVHLDPCQHRTHGRRLLLGRRCWRYMGCHSGSLGHWPLPAIHCALKSFRVPWSQRQGPDYLWTRWQPLWVWA